MKVMWSIRGQRVNAPTFWASQVFTFGVNVIASAALAYGLGVGFLRGSCLVLAASLVASGPWRVDVKEVPE